MTITTQQRPAPAQDQGLRDAALVPVSGILDVHDDRAFIRTSGYRPGPDDVYVPLTQVRQHGLRRGDHIAGAARAPGTAQAPRPGAEDRSGRQSKAAGKSGALVRMVAPESPTVTELTALGAP